MLLRDVHDDPALIVPAIIANEYNARRGWNPFAKRISTLQVLSLIGFPKHNAEAPQVQGVDAQEIIAIAKLVCKGMGYACPVINNL
jgi:hypothetical protein